MLNNGRGFQLDFHGIIWIVVFLRFKVIIIQLLIASIFILITRINSFFIHLKKRWVQRRLNNKFFVIYFPLLDRWDRLFAAIFIGQMYLLFLEHISLDHLIVISCGAWRVQSSVDFWIIDANYLVYDLLWYVCVHLLILKLFINRNLCFHLWLKLLRNRLLLLLFIDAHLPLTATVKFLISTHGHLKCIVLSWKLNRMIYHDFWLLTSWTILTFVTNSISTHIVCSEFGLMAYLLTWLNIVIIIKPLTWGRLIKWFNLILLVNFHCSRSSWFDFSFESAAIDGLGRRSSR